MRIAPLLNVSKPLPLSNHPDYRQMMIRELLIWLIGVPVPIAAVIGLFVL